jgi:hypothetical protein
MPMLSLTDFADLLQHPFPVSAGGARLVVTLTGASAVSGGIPGGRKPFALTFRGPAQPLLPQAMYDVEHPVHGVIAIFIVPIAADADGVTYEAVFG